MEAEGGLRCWGDPGIRSRDEAKLPQLAPAASPRAAPQSCLWHHVPRTATDAPRASPVHVALPATCSLAGTNTAANVLLYLAAPFLILRDHTPELAVTPRVPGTAVSRLL